MRFAVASVTHSNFLRRAHRSRAVSGCCRMWSYGHRFLSYHLYTPPAAASSSSPLPQVLWLHGGTWVNYERLDDNELINHTVFFALQTKHPHFVLRPIARRRSNWMAPYHGPRSGSHALSARPPPSLGLASALLDEVVHTLGEKVDRTHLIAVGASMGGYGVWELLERRPGLFRTAIAICGGTVIPTGAKPTG